MYLTLIYMFFFWRTQRFDVLWWFWFFIPLLRFKVDLWAIACFLMQQTNPHNQTPSLNLLVLFCENEFNATRKPNIAFEEITCIFLKLFQNTPIIKLKRSKLDYNVFHLICFQLYVWKCIIPLPSPNIFKHNLRVVIF